ncbi:MAG: hypothetical protein JNM68_16600, partial [Dinghuibacter sp.]|nr:hypothetical protein [Dinghuibacter sp.]
MFDKDLLIKPRSVNHFKGEKIPHLYRKGEQAYLAEFSEFTDSEFEKAFWLNDLHLCSGLVFNNCTFNGTVIFHNITAKGYQTFLNKGSQNLVFKNCTFKEPVRFTGEAGKFERDIIFEDCVFEQGLDVQHLQITAGSFILRNCTIHQLFDLYNLAITQELKLSGNTVNAPTRFKNLQCDCLLLVGGNIFEKKSHIRTLNSRLGITFNGGTYKEEFKLLNYSSPKGSIKMMGPKFEQSVYIRYELPKEAPVADAGSFYFEDCQFANGLYVNETNEKNAKQVMTDRIEFEISASLKGDLYFGNLYVNTLRLRGYNSAANLMFEELRIENIFISRFINAAGLIFKSIRSSAPASLPGIDQPRGSVEISNSNLGKAQFFNVDLLRYKTIYLDNNMLSDISFSMVQWFTEAQLSDTPANAPAPVLMPRGKRWKKMGVLSYYEEGRANYHLQCRQDLYRQLKIAAQRQGDIPQSLEFQRHEMNFYRQSLKLKSPNSYKERVTLWGEHAILWLNQTNDFGQNWLKALALLLLFSFIVYMPIGLLTSPKLNYQHWADSLSDVGLNIKAVFWDNLKTWIVTLNPAHRIDDLATNVK